MGTMPQTRAALYLPPSVQPEQWASAMAAVAETEGWPVVSLLRHWQDVLTVTYHELVQVVIIPGWEYLPPDRLPRLVPADTYRPPPLISGQRRPELLRPPIG